MTRYRKNAKKQNIYKLKKDDIIHKCKNKEDGVYFVFNPFIAHCSRRVPKELYKEFFKHDKKK